MPFSISFTRLLSPAYGTLSELLLQLFVYQNGQIYNRYDAAISLQMAKIDGKFAIYYIEHSLIRRLLPILLIHNNVGNINAQQQLPLYTFLRLASLFSPTAMFSVFL